ncbi:hypothetical protein [Pseudomonas viridiflava]|uniref:hypothetical protein n=1 Tax=Pseudomonas viridiflava TaxID=33069 RepID=UPI000F035F63|nr:hypothetical protein [Pseudomonas viridiflava]
MPPDDRLMAAVNPCQLVLELGAGWIRSVDALPWNDHRSWLLYVVYSPLYCGDLLICEFKVGGGVTWWHEGLEVGINGVTHWRLALDDDEDFTPLRGHLPAESMAEPEALADMHRWWCWYRAYKGLGLD